MLGPADGGTNWPGGSFNPETTPSYVYACNSCLVPIGLVPPPPGLSDLRYVVGKAGQKVTMINASGTNGRRCAAGQAASARRRQPETRIIGR